MTEGVRVGSEVLVNIGYVDLDGKRLGVVKESPYSLKGRSDYES
tara:strand:- start:1039 stop:1170 length:132 start_codon:yes stop_codon:yes gene_type:complete